MDIASPALGEGGAAAAPSPPAFPVTFSLAELHVTGAIEGWEVCAVAEQVCGALGLPDDASAHVDLTSSIVSAVGEPGRARLALASAPALRAALAALAARAPLAVAGGLELAIAKVALGAGLAQLPPPTPSPAPARHLAYIHGLPPAVCAAGPGPVAQALARALPAFPLAAGHAVTVFKGICVAEVAFASAQGAQEATDLGFLKVALPGGGAREAIASIEASPACCLHIVPTPDAAFAAPEDVLAACVRALGYAEGVRVVDDEDQGVLQLELPSPTCAEAALCGTRAVLLMDDEALRNEGGVGALAIPTLVLRRNVPTVAVCQLPLDASAEDVASGVRAALGASLAPKELAAAVLREDTSCAIVRLEHRALSEALLALEHGVTVCGVPCPVRQRIPKLALLKRVPASVSLEDIRGLPRWKGKAALGEVVDLRKPGAAGDVRIELLGSAVFNELLEGALLKVKERVIVTVEPVPLAVGQRSFDAAWYLGVAACATTEAFSAAAAAAALPPGALASAAGMRQLERLRRSRDLVFTRRWRPDLWLDVWANGCPADPAQAVAFRSGMRVTAMLSTMGAVRCGEYFLPDGRAVSLAAAAPAATPGGEKFRAPPQAPAGAARAAAPTRVLVLEQDCLLAAREAQQRGLRPCVLNLASQDLPGGGYRTGAGAQEENITRRSNYGWTVDRALAPASAPLYPLHVRGAVYSPRVTVFRDSEDTGYAFRAEPFDVAVVGVAARRRPRLTPDSQLLREEEHVLELYRKAQTVMAVALAKGHDCVVLGALGCGAYRNPPAHVALIFQLALQEYAGCFKEIIFAIIDDHNARQPHNPVGNFAPFFERLHGKALVALPGWPVPFHNREGGDLCRFGGACNQPHPADATVDDVPPCPEGVECADVGDTHRLLRKHPMCPRGALCELWQDAEHAERLPHPPACRLGGLCTEVTAAHLQRFCHVPLCEDGASCPRFCGGDPRHMHHRHCSALRHVRERCAHGTFCAQFADPAHLEAFSHPFIPPCPKTPYRCHLEGNREHTAQESHVCRAGLACPDIASSNHRRLFIHVPRQPCARGAACTITADKSLESCLCSYAHPGVPDIRKACRHQDQCTSRGDPAHVREYWHGLDFPAIPCDVRGLTLLRRDGAPIDFVANHAGMLEGIARHFSYANVRTMTADVKPDILAWVRSMRPVHRIKLSQSPSRPFGGMVAHGNMLSLELLRSLGDPAVAAREVRGHKLVHDIIGDRHLSYKETILDFMSLSVERQCAEDRAAAASADEGAKAVKDRLVQEAAEMEGALKALMQDDARLADLKAIAEGVASAVLKATTDKDLGIGYWVDVEMGTNKTVFAIFGPSPSQRCYGDIAVILRQEILHHPDYFMTMGAATSYHPNASEPMTARRPWGGALGRASYDSAKISPGVKGWEMVAAAELQAVTAVAGGKAFAAVSVADVEHFHSTRDSHQVFEAHLPPMVPFAFIDRIVMPEADKAALTAAEQRALDVMVGPARLSYVGAGRHDTYNKTLEHIRLPAAALRPKGFLFAASANYGHDTAPRVLPLRLPGAGGGGSGGISHVYFKARGPAFSIALLSHPQKGASTAAQHFFTVEAAKPGSMVDRGRAVCSNVPPAAYEGLVEQLDRGSVLPPAQRAPSCEHFNVGVFGDPKDMAGSYHLTLNHTTGELVLQHSSRSLVHNHMELRTNIGVGKAAALQWIGLAPLRGTVCFEGICIASAPRAEADPSAELARILQAHPGTVVLPRGGGGGKTFCQNCADGTPATKSCATCPSALCSACDDVLHKASAKKGHARVDAAAAPAPAPAVTPAPTPQDPHPHCSNFGACPIYFGLKPENKTHMANYMHLCRFGGGCREQGEAAHKEHFKHTALPSCPQQAACKLLGDATHRGAFAHAGFPDILIPCKDGADCTQKGALEHYRMYKH